MANTSIDNSLRIPMQLLLQQTDKQTATNYENLKSRQNHQINNSNKRKHDNPEQYLVQKVNNKDHITGNWSPGIVKIKRT